MSMSATALQTCDVVDCLPPSSAPALDSRQQCLLLIEDNEEAMLLVRYALQEYGNGTYRLEWANGLTSGLHRLAKGGVDLVILDLGLPESSGPASYATLKKAVPDLPILVLTADTNEQTQLRITSEGVEDFLLKEEVSGSLLLQAIRTALYSNRRWREQRNASYKQSPQFLWAQQSVEALAALTIRLLQLNRVESAAGAVKAVCAIVENYSSSESATIAGRVDLFSALERVARFALQQGLKDCAQRYRFLIVPPPKADPNVQQEFTAAMHLRLSELDQDQNSLGLKSAEVASKDLAQILREILESAPKVS